MSTVSDLEKKKFFAESFHAVANVMCLSSKIRLIENVLNSVHVLFLKFFFMDSYDRDSSNSFCLLLIFTPTKFCFHEQTSILDWLDQICGMLAVSRLSMQESGE